MRQIKRIFVHCTAGPQTQTVAEIQKYWKNVNRWKDPGYHYIIKPDGEIVKLQPEDKPSNGVAGYNSTSINVCYIGGIDKIGRPIDNRTEAQKNALSSILKDLHSRYPDAEILGHRDIWGPNPINWHKMCPCFDVKAELPTLLGEKKEVSVKEVVNDIEVDKPALHPAMGVAEIPIEPLVKPQNTVEKQSLWNTIISVFKSIFKK